MQYLLNRQEALETLTNVLIQPKKKNLAQHHLNMEAYFSLVRRNRYACFIMLSSMYNDFGEFENCPHYSQHVE